MANTNAPFGLRPLRHAKGGVIRSKAYRNGIASAYNTDIFTGDVVEMVASGTLARAAAANGDNWGVFAGCQYTDSDGKPQWKQYWPADTVATDIIAYVYDDPAITFEIQTDSSGLVAADVGVLCDWTVGTGNTATGKSATVVNTSSAATADASLRVKALGKRPGNAAGAYAVVEVEFAEHVLTNVVAGVGGVTT